MQAVRHLLAQRQVALWLCAATLILRLLVPTGYMIGSDHGHVAIIACPGVTAPVQAAAMPMMHHAAESRPSDHHPTDHGPSDGPCAFAGLSAAMLGAVDPVLLAGLVAYILLKRLDDIAYGTGLWTGVVRERNAGALKPQIRT